MTEKFEAALHDEKVRHDLTVLADFISIWCDGHHAGEKRHAASTDAAAAGVYGRKTPELCVECEAHLAYAEKRRAYCTQNPKPFCAHCEVHCYKADERAWQQAMMRYSGPKSWRRGHTVDGIKHALEARKWRREMARRSGGATPAKTTNDAAE